MKSFTERKWKLVKDWCQDNSAVAYMKTVSKQQLDEVLKDFMV